MTLSKAELRKLFSKKDYEVELFKEKEFIRKQCSNCGKFFWTLNPDQEHCGDTRCVGGYQFLGKKGKNLDFDRAIKSLTEFFVKNGHTAIKDYPVVARWRQDMDFTIASIADFQPWVLEGVIDPPANPLVVPQFCIRTGGEFSDIDNIGKTGRHLTGFVMFGQHAFNSERLKTGYWMDRCIQLNFEYLTKELNLKPEEITYTEGIWAGGGNFGPNLEAFAYGSELVNNVFIAYGFENGKVMNLPMRVIDVGWGLERVAWFTQGTPTIYEAIFPQAIRYLQKENGIKIDQKLLMKYGKLAGLLAVDEVKNMKEARKRIASQLGMSYKELEQTFGPQEAIYAISDHVRTLSIAIADGAIPSNVGGGYNLRMLLRRVLALQELYNLQFSLEKMFDLQIDHLSVSYPRVKDHREDIQRIIDLEVKRYRDTKQASKRIVTQLIKKKKKLDMKTLADLYQTRGINPLMIKEFAREHGVDLEFPEDFYIRLQEYIKPKEAKKKKQEERKVHLDESIKTYPLYYDDVYATEFEAKVIANVDNRHIVLDKTLFYPTGGGQLHDTGILIINDKEYYVEDVFKEGQAIVHQTKTDCPVKVGTQIKGRIDGKRRMRLMRHHTAVHVVNNAARTVLGSHVWQAGAEKTPEKARLDITHYKALSFDELQKIELLANQIVLENRKVNKIDLERDKAEREYGFSIYQGGVVPGKVLHIVKIENWDIEACGGTHLDYTGEIGLIKIIGSERIQDGVVRLEILAGEAAVLQMQKETALLHKASSIVSVEPKKLPQTVERFFTEWKKQRKAIEKLNKKIAELQFSQIAQEAEKIKGTDVIITEMEGNQKELIAQATEIVRNFDKAICVLISEDNNKVNIVGARSKDCSADIQSIVKEISEFIGGSGGGKGNLAIGGGAKTKNKESLIKKAREIISRALS